MTPTARSAASASIAVLIAYTLLAVAPILLVVMNSFKARSAIFGAPLAPAGRRDLLADRLRQGASRNAHVCTYFANSLIVTLGSMVLVLLFGAMAAWALTEYRFRGSTSLALYLSIGIMVPIRLGSVAILTMMRARRPQRHADRADPGLYRAGPADGDLHPERVHPADPAATCATPRAATACRRPASSSK